MARVTLAQDLETGDLAYDERGLRLAVGVDAVVVLLSNALRQQPYDDVRNPSKGIPYPTLLGKRPSLPALEGLLRKRAAEVAAVTTVKACKVTREGERLVTALTVRTDEGEVSTDFEVT